MNTNKEYYPIFVVDISTSPYSIDVVLIGAKDERDCYNHLKQALSNSNIDKEQVKTALIRYKDKKAGYMDPIKKIEGAHTDTPYTVLYNFSYYE